MVPRLIAASALLAAAGTALADGSNAGRPTLWELASEWAPALVVQGWRVGADASPLLGRQSRLVAEVIREQERALGETASIAGLGLRRELSRETTLSLSFGAGSGGPAAPRWRLIAGFEQSF